MKRLCFLALAITITMIVFAGPVFAFDTPTQGTANATDVIIWYGESLTVESEAISDALDVIGVAIQQALNISGLFMGLSALMFFSLLGFWRPQAILSAAVWMIAGGISLALGLYWYDIYTNEMGLTVSLVLIIYWLVCWGYAFAQLYTSRKVQE